MRIADKFTLARVLLAPCIFIGYFTPMWTGQFAALSVYVLLPVLVLTEFTDFLDGYFARRYQQVSAFGKLFDPFADVVLHLSLFTCLTVSGYMPPLVLILIIYREFSMLFIRLLAVQRGVAIGARLGGKAKTVLYVVTVFFSLLLESAVRLQLVLPALSALRIVNTVLFIGCAAAAYLSFIEYLVHFRAVLLEKKA